MKRRTFFTASGIVGLVGSVSSAPIVTSVYSSIHTNVLLEEFSPLTKNVLDKFTADVRQNFQAVGIDESLAGHVVNPVQIISKNISGKNQTITYKNKSGGYISLSIIEGVEEISISSSL